MSGPYYSPANTITGKQHPANFTWITASSSQWASHIPHLTYTIFLPTQSQVNNILGKQTQVNNISQTSHELQHSRANTVTGKQHPANLTWTTTSSCQWPSNTPHLSYNIPVLTQLQVGHIPYLTYSAYILVWVKLQVGDILHSSSELQHPRANTIAGGAHPTPHNKVHTSSCEWNYRWATSYIPHNLWATTSLCQHNYRWATPSTPHRMHPNCSILQVSLQFQVGNTAHLITTASSCQ